MVTDGAGLVVVDTNVVSYIFRGDDKSSYYREQLQGRRAILSFQTLEEMLYGAYAGGWGDRRKNELARHLAQYEVVWPSPQLVEVCARLRSEQKSAGQELQQADAWIAATAILLQCPLASHDRDFTGIAGLEIIQAP